MKAYTSYTSTVRMIDFVLEVTIRLSSASVQSVEQEEDHADANHPTQN